jgi:hypothetical protein
VIDAAGRNSQALEMRRYRCSTAAILLALGALVGHTGCSRCGDDVPEAREVAGSKALPWEQVELGVDPAGFRAAIASLAGVADQDAASRIGCRQQFTMDVIDAAGRTITERSGRKRSLSNCALLQAGSNRSWSLLSARGEFVDGKLMRLTFAFPKEGFAKLAAELESRLGAGAEVTLEDRSAVLLDSEARKSRLWKRDQELYALVEGDREARLIRQDAALGNLLPPMPEAGERGKPVDLDDIGLGGRLDLDASLPDVDGLIGGDH